jgi:hypothetical protein
MLSKKFGGSFIRLDTFVDDVERLSDGIQIRPIPKNILAYRKKLDIENVEIWADIHVKHTKLLDGSKTLLQSAQEAIAQGADKVIVTGDWTGAPPCLKDLLSLRQNMNQTPILIGSGINAVNIRKYLPYCDAIIVGTALKENGYVSLSRVHTLCQKQKNTQISKSKHLLVISSFSWDHIYSEKNKKAIIQPGGPAYFITRALQQKCQSFAIETSNITHVFEYLNKGESIGSRMQSPPKIPLPKQKYTHYLISTQLQEFDVSQIEKIKGATIYLDLQGYTSSPTFKKMRRLEIDPKIWRYLSFVKCNEREIEYLPSNFLEYVKQHKTFILTKGKDGVEFYIQGKRYLIAMQPIKTKNTLGAGDTFLANFTYFHMTGYSIQMAIKKSLQETKKFLQNKY